jgi:hypothetical protein
MEPKALFPRLSPAVQSQRRGISMARTKPTVRPHVIAERSPRAQPYGRTLSARRYLELGRQPRLSNLPTRRPPYLEAAATAAAFIYLAYLVLGGA